MTISAPIRDLLQLALGSFPRSQAEKDRSRALLRCAYRGRTRKIRLSIVENCGGPGSGKPGPCPLYRASDQEDDDANEAQGGYQALGAGVYLAEDPESVKGYGKYIKKYSIPNESLLSVAGDIGLQPHRDAAKEWADSKIKEHLKDAKDGKIKINGQLLAEMTNPASQLRAYLESKGYKGIRYVQTDKKNDHHSQVLVFRREHLTRNTTNARPLKTDIRVKELAPYLHDLLGDVTKRDAKAIARIVKRGVERRWKDSSVARAIVRSTKIEPDRAKVIARTEMARARTDVGLGKKRDSDKVVFTLGAVDKTCPKCRALEGKVYTVRKAAGVIPVHPNCRCFWSDAPKGARVSNANPKGCNQYSGKGCSTGSKYKILPLDEESSHVESHLEVFGDTHRLASSLPTQVDLSKIRQPAARGKDYDRSIENLASKIRASKSIRPIVLVEDGDEYYTLDGDHRVSAFKNLGEKTIPAMVLVKKSRVSNVFCATGDGGGVDPSCGANGPKLKVRSTDLPAARDQDLTDADGVSLLKQDLANDLKISLARIDQAEQGHVSKRRVSRDAEADNEIINALSSRSKFKSDFVGRGLVFDTEQEAANYVKSLVSLGYYETSKNPKSTPESFSDDPEIARRFATVKGAQVIPGDIQNGHGVLLQVLPKKGNSYRGYRLDYGEGEVILPRGQAYRVVGSEEARSASGFVLHTIKLQHA